MSIKFRNLDANGDWIFGQGQQSFLQNNAAILKCCKTRLESWRNDYFRDFNFGVDWFNYLSNIGTQLQIQKAVRSETLRVLGVTGINSISFIENKAKRTYNITINIITIYDNASDVYISIG